MNVRFGSLAARQDSTITTSAFAPKADVNPAPISNPGIVYLVCGSHIWMTKAWADVLHTLFLNVVSEDI